MTHTVCCIDSSGKMPQIPGYGESDGVAFNTGDNRDNAHSPCFCYQMMLEQCTSDVIIYIHDDVAILDDDWLSAVMRPFHLGVGPELSAAAGDRVVAVGLGGATSLGRPDLYRKPYFINNMARGGYGSNMVDAEIHGTLELAPRRVAVLDAFFMAIRVDWLRQSKWGGWPVGYITHHCMDLWLACEAARRGGEIWTVPVACNHYGGSMSISESYAKAKWLWGGTPETDHALPHKWLFNEYRDVLPIVL